jgi:hypothetical protein
MSAGAQAFVIDEARLANANLVFPAGEATDGVLTIDGGTLRLGEVGGAYFRPYGLQSALERVEFWRRATEAARLERLQSALWAWSDITPARVLNRPALMATNGCKPLQARLLAACGFAAPETIVTCDPAAAREFLAQHGTAIYKSVSGTRSVVARITEAACDRLSLVPNCPVQFQAYVPGIDVRVHVVGDALFACEVQSTADDYRYAARSGQHTRITACALPPDIEARCLAASLALGLPLCGIDLRRTPDGRWVAFEANPSPGFTYFAQATGAPIAAAIASLLTQRQEQSFFASFFPKKEDSSFSEEKEAKRLLCLEETRPEA